MKNLTESLISLVFALFVFILSSCSSSGPVISVTAVDYRHVDIVLESQLAAGEVPETDDFAITSTYSGFEDLAYAVSSVTVDPEGTGDLTKVRIELNKCMLPVVFSFKYGKSKEAEFTWTGRAAFITKAKGTGDFKNWENAGENIGLDAADAVCQAEADEAGLVGTFKAWLSDRNDDAKDRIGANTGGWVRTDGYPLALSMEALSDATLPPSQLPQAAEDSSHGTLVPLWFHADGSLSTEKMVRTNTYPTGTRQFDTTGGTHETDCQEWNTASDDAYSSYAGAVAGASPTWTYLNSYYSKCSDELPHYCFQTGDDAPEIKAADYKTSGKLAFVTSTVRSGGDMDSIEHAGCWGNFNDETAGIPGADLTCQNFAQDAGLENYSKFKAWISNDITNAISRLTYSGPWVLLNGVKIADNKAELVSGSVFTPINVNENGERQYARESGQVLTGTDTDGNSVTGYNCNDWNSLDGGGNVTVGTYFSADAEWTSYESWAGGCAFWYNLYCLEDE